MGEQVPDSEQRRRAGLVTVILLGLGGGLVAFHAVQLFGLLRLLVRLGIAQKALLREMLAELRRYGADSAAAFEAAMVAAFPAAEEDAE